MTSASYVAQRTDRLIDRDFPARPTLPRTIPCDGLAFVQPTGAPIPPLRPLRESIVEIRRGPIDTQAGPRELVLVTFIRPTQVDGDGWPAALPLVASGAATLSSFAQDAGTHADVPRPARYTGFRRVELWWGGALHRIAVETLAPVPVAMLWDMPTAALHLSAPRVTGPAPRSSGSAVPLLKKERGNAKVSHATIPFGEDGADLLADMAGKMREIDERTKLSSIFRQMRARMRGEGGEAGEPGILQNLAGWVRWHTPLGDSLRRQFGDRLSLVEKLIAAGDLDAALKLALKLGGGKQDGKQRNRFPNALPGARASLDFDFSRFGFSMPVLSDHSYHSMTERYRQLAEQLERGGDFRRAAYIHSQLLENHQKAVLVLEKGKLYAEAARLALGARLDPALSIRMLYKAGQRDAALALARRAACFEQLAEESRGKDGEFHAYVIKAWTDMLIATGQPLRALQITDALAKELGEGLIAVRRRWLAAALAQAGDSLGGELIARALLMAAWTAEDIAPRGIEDFPFAPVAAEAHPFAAALAATQAMVRGEGEHAGDNLIELLGSLLRIAAPDNKEQAAFWAGPAPHVIENFGRALVEVASSRLTLADLQSLQALLRTAKLPVIASDVQKLRKLYAAEPAPSREYRVAPVAAVRPAIRRACLLANGQMLIWRESQMLELLDRHGAPLWREGVSDVIGLVAVGTSPNVLIVQARPDGGRLLTRFSSHDRGFHAIGAVDLAAHHDITSESQWMVQIGGNIGALDLAKLCAPVPAIEFLWSCALTDRVRALAFAHTGSGPAWLTVDISPGRFGVVEMWVFRPNGELVTNLCTPPRIAGGPEFPPPGDWFWETVAGSGRIGSIGDRRWMTINSWTDRGEESARFLASRRRGADARIDRFQPCDFGRAYVSFAAREIAGEAPWIDTSVVDPGGVAPPMILQHDAALNCLARGVPAQARAGRKADSPTLLLFGDEGGRLFLVDAKARRVTQI